MAEKQMFNILSHQENTNQNYFEIPSYILYGLHKYDSFSENWKLLHLKTQLYHSWAYAQRMLHYTTMTFAQLCSLMRYS